MADDMGNKTEMPTARKLADARAKGMSPRSIDLSAAVDMIGAVLLIWLFGDMMVGGLSDLMSRLLTGDGPGTMLDKGSALRAFTWALGAGARTIWPVVALMFALMLLAQLQQSGFKPTLKPLELKFDRMNPAAGLARLFSRRSVVKTGVSVVKFVVVTSVVVLFVTDHLQAMAGLPMLSAKAAMGAMFGMIVELAIWVLAVMLVMGVADWAYQKWQFIEDLKMTKQEVKDERKSMEGDTEVKHKRLRMGREAIMQRIAQSVPKANVVVTNPTHYAVALRYDAATMAAPVVVAMGADYLAFRIREVAVASGVPIVEKPSLARGLYATASVGKEISPQFYEAVAEILAYVYRLDGAARASA